MTITIVDSYSESNMDTQTRSCVSYPTGPPTLYQSFTAAVDGVLDSCVLYLKKNVGATGNAQAILYAHTGTYGTSSDYTGAALATSENFDISTLGTSMGLATFNFIGANRYKLVSATKYCIALYNNNAGVVYWGQDGSSPAHGGNPGYDYGGHVATNTLDNCFYVYADVPSGFFF